MKIKCKKIRENLKLIFFPEVHLDRIRVDMGGHEFNIIIYEWVWTKAKHIGRSRSMSSHSMFSRIRVPNHLHPVRSIHHSVCFLSVRFWVDSWVYHALKIMLSTKKRYGLNSMIMNDHLFIRCNQNLVYADNTHYTIFYIWAQFE